MSWYLTPPCKHGGEKWIEGQILTSKRAITQIIWGILNVVYRTDGHIQLVHTGELKCLIVDFRRVVVTCAMLRPLRNIFHYSAIKMVAVTLVVTVSLTWHMQWTKKRLLLVFSANSLQSNLRFGLPNSSQFSCQFHNLGFWIRNPRSEIQKGSETKILTWWTSQSKMCAAEC